MSSTNAPTIIPLAGQYKIGLPTEPVLLTLHAYSRYPTAVSISDWWLTAPNGSVIEQIDWGQFLLTMPGIYTGGPLASEGTRLIEEQPTSFPVYTRSPSVHSTWTWMVADTTQVEHDYTLATQSTFLDLTFVAADTLAPLSYTEVQMLIQAHQYGAGAYTASAEGKLQVLTWIADWLTCIAYREGGRYELRITNFWELAQPGSTTQLTLQLAWIAD